jgi:probable rRNA maturation factor
VSRPTEFKLSIVCRAGRQFAPYLRTHLPKAWDLTRTQLAELSLALVGDAEMADLHMQFLGIPGPTDVLTFPLDQDERGRDIAGEVIVCIPEARRQAMLNGNRPEQEVLLYALHGVLHLSGFDDRTPVEFRKMHRKEDEILQKLGIGPVFSKAQGSSKPAGSRSKLTAIRKTQPIRRVAGEV